MKVNNQKEYMRLIRAYVTLNCIVQYPKMTFYHEAVLSSSELKI